jgi:outer membrane receptor protein involved in Fe transport
MMNKIALLLALLISGHSFAQQPGSRQDLSGLPAEGILTGQVVDKADGLPMEYVNIVIYSMHDSSMVNGIITSADGRFRLENIPYGRHYGIANFIGYDKMVIPDIRVTPKQKEVDLGTIFLSPASAELEGVEVTAERVHVEYKIDKKVINVGQDLMAAGNTAIEVLENTPSVQVDIEGNVTLRGSSNFTVLIDGRPSILTGSDALQQIPASTIDQIEIITNPSARYDPDGVGGIINVVLKKQRRPGINGVVNLSVGSKNKYRGDILLNYRTGKLNVFGGVDYNHFEFSMRGRNEYESFMTDTIFYRHSDFRGNMNRKGYGIKGGVDFFLNDKNTFNLSGRYGGFAFNRTMRSSRQLFYEPASTHQYSRSVSTMNRESDFYELSLGHTLKFNNKGHQLDFLAFFSNRDGDNAQDQENYLTDAGWNIIDDSPDILRIEEDSDDRDIRLKLDYSRPVGQEGKLEAGYQSRFEGQHETYDFYDWNYALGQWIENPDFVSESDFTRNIHAVYGMYSNTSGSFGYQAGLRGEYTDRRIENQLSPEAYIIDRFDLFPTLHLSRQFEGGHQAMASYGRRINRPRGRELDPFIHYFDPYNVRQGNPALEPEYIDSYELSYQKRLKTGFVSFETYYRINKNKITQIQRQWEDGIVLQTFQNLNRDFSLGAELMVNLSVTKWLDLNGSVNVYDYRLEGNVEGVDISAGSTNWDGRLNSTVKLPEDFRVQVTLIYRGPTVTAQGESTDFLMTNVAIRKDFMNRKMNAILSVRDLFSTGKREFITNGIGFYAYDYFKRESPVVNLSLSYIINNYKRQRDGSGRGDDAGGGDIDMEF